MVLSEESFQDLGVIDMLCNMSYIDDIKYFKARSQEIPPGRVDYTGVKRLHKKMA